MMGRTHESTSALAWLGACTIGLTHPVGQVAAGVVVAAGAGILPDLDHPCATPAHAFPPISGFVARGVSQVAGGHRHRTHTLVSILAIAGLTAAVEAWTHGPWWTLSIVFVCTLFAVRVLGPKSVRHGVIASLVAAVAITWLVYKFVTPGVWLWEAVTIGYAAHLAGDLLSEAGEPLLWPWGYRFKIPLEPVPVDSVREHLVASVAGVAVLWLAWGVLSPPLHHLAGAHLLR